mmetsp:Transcript_10073/g.30896  ORF Transcript_10073/g.30896 Transcript_10073/m.30896 type:complete len:90 (-) Transcript_10073:644-913(-)
MSVLPMDLTGLLPQGDKVSCPATGERHGYRTDLSTDSRRAREKCGASLVHVDYHQIQSMPLQRVMITIELPRTDSGMRWYCSSSSCASL